MKETGPLPIKTTWNNEETTHFKYTISTMTAQWPAFESRSMQNQR